MHGVLSIEICIFFEILKIWLKCAAYKVFLYVWYFCYCCSFHYWKVQFYDVWIKIYTSFLFIFNMTRLYTFESMKMTLNHSYGHIKLTSRLTLVHGILSNISDSQEKEQFCKDHPMTIYFPMYNLIKIGYLLDFSLFSYCHHLVPVICPYTWNLVYNPLTNVN